MFPWNSPSNENCGCKLPTKQKPRSIFKRIASATGQWIADLIGTSSGQLIVRDGSTLGYYKPNCEGLLKVDTDGNASVGNVESLEGPASGNPLGYGFLPYLELFDKSICDPDGGAPTEEQWMRIKALMPQWISTGEIAVLTAEECGSEKVRFDFLQPCPLPANGCPPSGLGYLASHVQQITENGCCKDVRRWYWVSGVSIPDSNLVRNAEGTVDINPSELPGEETFLIPVLRKRGGCWFFESMTRNDLVGEYMDGDLGLIDVNVPLGGVSYIGTKQVFNLPDAPPNARWAIVNVVMSAGSQAAPPSSALAVLYGYYGTDQTKEIRIGQAATTSGSQTAYNASVVDLPIVADSIALKATITIGGADSNAFILANLIGYR